MKPLLFALLPVLLIASCSAVCADCEEDPGGMCPSLTPIPPELAAVISYEDEQVVRFFAPATGETVDVTVERSDREPVSDGFCDGQIIALLENQQADYPFRLQLNAEVWPAEGIFFDLRLPVLGRLASEQFTVRYAANGTPSTDAPNTVRSVGEMMLGETLYPDVVEFTVGSASEADDIRRFYYNNERGLLQIDRISGTALVLVE